MTEKTVLYISLLKQYLAHRQFYVFICVSSMHCICLCHVVCCLQNMFNCFQANISLNYSTLCKLKTLQCNRVIQLNVIIL
ncbi:hypothetical protein FKM82_006162 [Ascaphus truei]